MNFLKLIKDFSFLNKVETKHHVVAFAQDEAGNVTKIFNKEVTFEKAFDDRIVIQIDGPIAYYLDDLKRGWLFSPSSEFNPCDFCIDECGLNHGLRNQSVYIKRAAMIELCLKAERQFAP